MTLISVQLEDNLESTSSFITLEERVLNILQKHDLDGHVSTVVEETTTNEGKINFKKNKAKAKHIIFDLVKDNLMSMIILLKNTRNCFDTLTNIFKNKDSSEDEG